MRYLFTFFTFALASVVANDVTETFSNNAGSVPVEESPLASMLHVSQMVYQYVNIRDVIRKHELTVNGNSRFSEEERKERQIIEFDSPGLVVTENGSDEDDVFVHSKLKYEITPSMILEFIQKNRGYLKLDDGGNIEFDETGTNTEIFPSEYRLRELKENFDADIVEYDDFKVNNEGLASELLYTVIVNRSEKRITVCFRGSVTPKDWVVDGSFVRRKPNATEFPELADKGIKIHRGFYGYLFRDTKDRNMKSKYDQICALLKELYTYKGKGRDYSDYTLYVTGHSLGGALSQLFAFMIAASDAAKSFLPPNKPVIAVTYASPEVGNKGYEKHFNMLEKQDRLRHLRVSNQGDLVAFILSSIAPLLGWKQPGVNVHVAPNKAVEIAYDKVKMAFAFSNPLNMHNLDVYRQRLFNKENLGLNIDSKCVEDFYNEKRVTLSKKAMRKN